MRTLTDNPKLLIVSSYPPRECGIATFSQDLAHAIEKMFGCTLPVEICALENSAVRRKYGKRVTHVLDTASIEQYRVQADAINERDDIGTVCIQHEFGLFSGHYGDALLAFMLALNKPIITVFHTVLPDPDEKRSKVVKAIFDLSDRIIVQTERSRQILIEEYDCPAHLLTVIPHGTHVVAWKDKAALKEKFGFADNLVLSTFGLLSENKGIETVLHALPDVVRKNPKVKYLILGRTHPEVVKHEGERYRDKLKEIIRELHLQDNVVFIDRYLELNELLEYLRLSDMYLFSSKDPHQAVSGTFVYAQSAGCPVISTPIPHARECIDGGTGVLLNGFDDPQEFRAAILDLMENTEKRNHLGKEAFAKMRCTSWENSAIAYGKMFGDLTNKAEFMSFQLPPISPEHILEMTTEFGMFQFAHFDSPDPGSGYTLDDNARALIAMVMYYRTNPEKWVLDRIRTYLNFIGFVQQPDGSFLNYVNYGMELTEQNATVNLEDACGRAMWALGFLLSESELFPTQLTQQATDYWQKAIDHVQNFRSPRAMAFVIKGLYYHHRRFNDELSVRLTTDFSATLLEFYHIKSDPEWHWYEDYLTYANSILPEAMLYAYLITDNDRLKEIAEVTFDFLLSNYFMKGTIKVISNRGWFNKRNERNFFGEQPIEVAGTIFALEAFYEVTGKSKYKDQMEVAFSWFLGNNHLDQIMYNPKNGACYDGLEEGHVNINQGAESTLCYFVARLIMEKYADRNRIALEGQLLFLCDCEDTTCKELAEDILRTEMTHQ